MTQGYPQPTYIYHMTHIDNLPSILSDGFLYADNLLGPMSRQYKRIGYAHIKQKRQANPGTEINAGDYVPFYFAPRSPMLYVISQGGVEGYSEGQGPIIHLVSTVQAVADQGLHFVVSDGNAASNFTTFYHDLAGLNAVDWELMQQSVWTNTAQYPDRMRRRQAEFLVKDAFPINLLYGIGTLTVEVANHVRSLVSDTGIHSRILPRPSWYY